MIPMHKANFQVFGRIELDECYTETDRSNILKIVLDEIQTRMDDTGLASYGTLSPVVIRFFYELGSLALCPSFRFAFYFHDTMSMNKFKLKYPEISGLKEAWDEIGLVHDSERISPQSATNIARVAIVYNDKNFEETCFYNYETGQLAKYMEEVE